MKTSCDHVRDVILTLHVEHHAVGDPLIPIGHDTRELLLVGLAARHHHVVAPYRHRAVCVAGLLEGRLALQPGVPLDHALGLAIGRQAGGDGHLAFLGPGDDGGRRQGHTRHGPSCREERSKKSNY